MEWWLWAILGIALLGGEMLTPGGFFLLFFGFSGIIVAVLVGIGIGGPVWMQWLLFSLFSIVLLIGLRKKFLQWASSKVPPTVDSLEGQTALSKSEIAPGQIGQVELRGAVWSGRNVGLRAINDGVRVKVLKVSGLTLEVKREDE
jgi:inner membrane protein